MRPADFRNLWTSGWAVATHERRVFPNVDGVNNAIRLLGMSNDKIRQLKGANLIDDSIVRKLDKEGLF